MDTNNYINKTLAMDIPFQNSNLNNNNHKIKTDDLAIHIIIQEFHLKNNHKIKTLIVQLQMI